MIQEYFWMWFFGVFCGIMVFNVFDGTGLYDMFLRFRAFVKNKLQQVKERIK